MWGKIIIPMYRLWLNGLYGLYGPRCPLFSKRPINLISLSLSIRPSVCLWTESYPLCIFYNTCRIHFIFTHLIKQLQKMCRVQCFRQNKKNWSFGKLFKCFNFDFVFVWLGVQYELVNSMGNHRAAGVSSECRHSSCSSLFSFHMILKSVNP